MASASSYQRGYPCFTPTYYTGSRPQLLSVFFMSCLIPTRTISTRGSFLPFTSWINPPTQSRSLPQILQKPLPLSYPLTCLRYATAMTSSWSSLTIHRSLQPSNCSGTTGGEVVLRYYSLRLNQLLLSLNLGRPIDTQSKCAPRVVSITYTPFSCP